MARTTKKKDPAKEAQAPTTATTAQEESNATQDPQEKQEGTAQAQEDGNVQEDTTAQEEGKQDAPEQFAPYQATVTVPLVVIRRGSTPNPKDKPIGTLGKGARVTVTASLEGYAMLDNGTYLKEDYLERTAP